MAAVLTVLAVTVIWLHKIHVTHTCSHIGRHAKKSKLELGFKSNGFTRVNATSPPPTLVIDIPWQSRMKPKIHNFHTSYTHTKMHLHEGECTCTQTQRFWVNMYARECTHTHTHSHAFSLSLLLSIQTLTHCTQHSMHSEARLKSASGAEYKNWVSSENLWWSSSESSTIYENGCM